jgi:hypothetical protein
MKVGIMRNLVFLGVCLAFVIPCQARIITVDCDGPADFNNIQSAIYDSNDGDTIVVMPGTYTGIGNRDIDFLGKAITVRSTDPNDPNIVAATVIDCQGTESELHRGFYFDSNEGSDSIIDGLTITHGYGYCGGAIFCGSDSVNPTIQNCIITENSTSFSGSGGAIDIFQSLTIKNCKITDNEGGSGGAIYCRSDSKVDISNCVINSNVAVRYGGGAMYCHGGSKIKLSNTIIGENAASYGGAIYCLSYETIISNCTIYGNTASTKGETFFIANPSFETPPHSFSITNSILWDSSPQIDIYNSSDMILEMMYSDVKGGWPGQGNIDTDPCLVNPGGNDFHLQSNSPCINAGDPNYVPVPNETDLDGNPRVIDGRIDIGAYEYTYTNKLLFFAVSWDGWFTHIDSILGQIDPVRSDLPKRLQALARSPDGTFYAGREGNIYTIDPWTGDTEFVVSVNTDIRGMAFSPDGKLYVTSEWTTSFRLRTVDIETGNVNEIGVLWGDNKTAQGLAFSPEGILYAITPNILANTYELLTIDMEDCQMHSLGSYKNTTGVNQSLYALGNNSFAQLNPENGAIIGTPLPLYQDINEGEYRGLALVPTLSNMLPVADTGPNQVAYTWIDGIAEVTLDGSASYDPDGDELTYLWQWSVDGNDYEANGVNPTIELPVGQHTIELLVNDGFEDSEPNYVEITVVEPIEGMLRIAPQIINRHCVQKRIMTTLCLPEGITRDQIDNNSMLLLYPGEVEAQRQFVTGIRRVCIFAVFDRDEILEAIGGAGSIEVYVVGQLKTGQYFYGSDTMRIIGPGCWPPRWNMRDWFHNRRWH